MRRGPLFRKTKSYNKFKKKWDRVDAQADALLRDVERNPDAYRPADLRKEAGKVSREYDAIVKEIAPVIADMKKRDWEEAKAAERDVADLLRTIEEARADFEDEAGDLDAEWYRIRDEWVELKNRGKR